MPSSEEKELQELKSKFDDLHRVFLGLNAFGSLELPDLRIIENQIKSSFKVEFTDS